MSLTFAQLQSVIQAVCGASVPTGIDETMIMNSAGNHLFNMHPWNFKEGGSVNLSFVPDRDWVELPVDCDGITAYAMSSSLQCFEFTTPQEIAELRDSSVTSSGYKYWGAVVQPPSDVITQALPAKRIDLYPTPSSSATLKIWYRRGWATLASGSIAQIPQFAEPLLIELVKAFALGHWAGLGAKPNFGVYENLQAIQDSPLFHACALNDGLAQPDYGLLVGGATTEARYGTWRSRTSGAVADPA